MATSTSARLGSRAQGCGPRGARPAQELTLDSNSLRVSFTNADHVGGETTRIGYLDVDAKRRKGEQAEAHRKRLSLGRQTVRKPVGGGGGRQRKTLGRPALLAGLRTS
jgi:hypothetical protein